jgi:hypothetical protein
MHSIYAAPSANGVVGSQDLESTWQVRVIEFVCACYSQQLWILGASLSRERERTVHLNLFPFEDSTPRPILRY